MNKSDSLKAKTAVAMSNNFFYIFFGAILIIDLLVGAIMMVFFGKSLGDAFCVAIGITIVVPFVLSMIYGLFISPSRHYGD